MKLLIKKSSWNVIILNIHCPIGRKEHVISAEVRVHDSILPQTYLKSHIKFVHENINDIRIEVIVLESKKVVEHGKIFF